MLSEGGIKDDVKIFGPSMWKDGADHGGSRLRAGLGIRTLFLDLVST